MSVRRAGFKTDTSHALRVIFPNGVMRAWTSLSGTCPTYCVTAQVPHPLSVPTLSLGVLGTVAPGS